MTTDRLARIYDFYRRYDGLPYDASGNDADRDGLPDRADLDDGNGVDCSGCQWAAFKYAWEPDPAPFPLGSTSSYAAMARDRGLFVPLSQVRAGDILLHASNGDIYHSDGPVGHTEMFGERLANGLWRCWGSSSSGAGVGFVDRAPSFWQAAFRIPGLEDHSQPLITTPGGFLMALTDQQQQQVYDNLVTLVAFKDEITKPGNRPWSGALLKLADLHAFMSEVKDRVRAAFGKLGV